MKRQTREKEEEEEEEEEKEKDHTPNKKQRTEIFLPSEVWCHILGFLDVAHLKLCKSLCRQMRVCANDVLLQILSTQRIDFLKQLYKTADHVETWQWSCRYLHWTREEILDNEGQILHNLIERGCLSICMWLQKTFCISRVDICILANHPLSTAARAGQLAMCQWLHNTFQPIQKTIRNNALSYAASEGHLDVCRWLYSTSLFNTNTSKTVYGDICWETAVNGHLSVCKWLAISFPSAARATFQDEETFECVASHGHIHVCCWLYETFKPPIENNFHSILFDTVSSGNLELCKWLYSLNPSQAQTKWNMIFCDAAVQYGRLHICKWMHTTVPLPKENPDFRENTIRVTVCGDNNVEMCIWLHHILSFTPQEKMGLLLRACTCRIDICMWIHNLFPEGVKECRYLAFRRAFQCAYFPVCDWLETTFQLDPMRLRDVLYYAWISHEYRPKFSTICQWMFMTYGLLVEEDLHINLEEENI